MDSLQCCRFLVDVPEEEEKEKKEASNPLEPIEEDDSDQEESSSSSSHNSERSQSCDSEVLEDPPTPVAKIIVPKVVKNGMLDGLYDLDLSGKADDDDVPSKPRFNYQAMG